MPKVVPYKKDGKTYYKFQIYTGINPETNKRGMTTRSGFKSKTEAKIEMNRLELKIRNKQFYEKVSKDIEYTFKEVLDMYWESYRLTVRPSTLVKVDSIFKNQILPHFENKIINRITTNEIQLVVNKWSKYESCNSYINYTNKVFDYALKMEMIDKNPVDAIIRPKKKAKKKSKDFWNKQELKSFLAEAEKSEFHLAYPLFRLLAFCGIRKGEALALKWTDINLDKRVVNINKTIARSHDGVYIENTKNNSNREVSIDQSTLDSLVSIKVDNPLNLIFVNENNSYIAQSKPRIWLRSICKKINLEPIKVHGLRHTHASLLFEAGANIKEVQARLGHSNAQITMNIYTHVTEQYRDDFADKFSDFVDF